MYKLILVLFACLFSAGLYFILAQLLGVPTLRTTRAVLSMGKREKKEGKSLDAALLDLTAKLAAHIHLDDYRRRKLGASLKSAEIPLTPETYVAGAYVKAGLLAAAVIPALWLLPILAPVLLVAAVGVYFQEMNRAEKIVQARRDEIEYELPRFVATISQSLLSNHDVLTMLESYMSTAGPALKNELAITTADMRTGNYEAALMRFEARVNSAMLSDTVRGLIGVTRGDDGIVHFKMLARDMKQIEFQRLKRLALERPPKIRKYSMLLLMCMLILFLGVMGYQIIDAMGSMF